jgi:hypothetical protein
VTPTSTPHLTTTHRYTREAALLMPTATSTCWPEIAVDAIDMARAARTIIEELGLELASDLTTALMKSVFQLEHGDVDDIGWRLESLVRSRTDIEVRVLDECPHCNRTVSRPVFDTDFDEHLAWCSAAAVDNENATL